VADSKVVGYLVEAKVAKVWAAANAPEASASFRASRTAGWPGLARRIAALVAHVERPSLLAMAPISPGASRVLMLVLGSIAIHLLVA
jgi:hypothetical protein